LRTEDRRQRTEDRKQRTENRRQKTENRKAGYQVKEQKAEDRGQII
jgi:hypothetical protein